MAGIDGFGTVLARGDGATPEVFVAIGNTTSIEGPGLKRDTRDVTAHDSPDRYMEFIGGLVNGGDVSVDLNYDPVKHDLLVEDLEDTDPVNYKLTFPDTSVWAFPALLTELTPKAPYDDKLSASLKFQVSGKPDITDAS
ncbi:MAG: phage tail tube protein [Pseudonocardiaceae bacterium]